MVTVKDKAIILQIVYIVVEAEEMRGLTQQETLPRTACAA